MAPKQSYKSQTDFIPTPLETKNVTNFDESNSYEFQTNYRLIYCELEKSN